MHLHFAEHASPQTHVEMHARGCGDACSSVRAALLPRACVQVSVLRQARSEVRVLPRARTEKAVQPHARVYGRAYT
eukprot:1168318-Pleurochrysis_carterae.AAC.2